MQSDAAAAVAANRVGDRSSVGYINSFGERAAVHGFLALFAVLLAAVTCKHEIYLDEAQAWLIARDSRSLVDLFHQLHYESHPAFWYLLLYIPAHLSAQIVWMQCINYTLAV